MLQTAGKSYIAIIILTQVKICSLFSSQFYINKNNAQEAGSKGSI